MTRQIIYLDPTELSIHPLLKKQGGEWETNDPRFEALCDDIKSRGIDQPLRATKELKLADGRNRLRAAKQVQLAKVPVLYCEDDEVQDIIIQSLLRRRHYTKGQRAYLLAPAIESAFELAYHRQLAGKPVGSKLSFEGQKTVEGWAQTIGVSPEYLRRARSIHESFQDDKKRKIGDEKKALTLREYFEPRIMDEDSPMGLNHVVPAIAGIVDAEKKGKPHKGGKPDDQQRQLELFNKVVEDEVNRWEYWQKFDEDTQKKHFQTVRAQAAKIDPKQLEEMAEYHSRLASEFRKAAKEAAAASGN